MAKRILLGGILGGLALFMWGGLSHMVIGLGQVGIQNIQKPVYDSMKASIAQGGFYFFPESDVKGNIKDEYKNGPTGILIFKPTGAGASMGGQLINETILNIVQALIAASFCLLQWQTARYPHRVGFVFVLGNSERNCHQYRVLELVRISSHLHDGSNRGQADWVHGAGIGGSGLRQTSPPQPLQIVAQGSVSRSPRLNGISPVLR